MQSDTEKIVLTSKIRYLISTRREGDFWDFKVEHHADKTELLHDILCMANSMYSGDRYIIIGVKNGTGEICGSDEKRTQSDIIDFLSHVNFSGQNRPEIEMHKIEIDGKVLDIIIIFDKHVKPYFLNKDYPKDIATSSDKFKGDKKKILRANYIYTRVGDKNTAKDMSADIYHVEQMWQQRFGINLSVIERLRLFMKDRTMWLHSHIDNNFEIKSVDDGEHFPLYHKVFPEFQIEISEDDRGSEPFCYFFHNPDASFGTVHFKYLGTILFKMQYVRCDGGRLFLPCPDYTGIENTSDFLIYYYLEDSDKGLFYNFLKCTTHSSTRTFNKIPIFTFANKRMLDNFVQELYLNIDTVKNIEIDLPQNVKNLNDGDGHKRVAAALMKIKEYYDKHYHIKNLMES